MKGNGKGSGMGSRIRTAAQSMDAAAAAFEAVSGASAEAESERPAFTHLNVRLPNDVYTALRLKAFNEHTSITALIVSATRDLLAKS